MHDYTSQAPYWWPSPTADGSPYVRRDGQKNPEVYNYSDRVDLGKVFHSVFELSLAWFYTRNDAYSQHAALILRTWFLDDATHMNPNLNHAQMIPFANTGRCIGIIDFSQGYSSVLDAAAILNSGGHDGASAPGWTADDAAKFRDWNAAFLHWLTKSPFGQEESAQKNNHGVFAAMQKAAIAQFLGQTDQVKQELLVLQGFIDSGIAADGSQPEEIKRTRSWHYSVFSLLALTRGAMIGERAGVHLWTHTGLQGQTISKAVEHLIPAATSRSSWPHPELKFDASAAADVIRTAAAAGSEAARASVASLALPPTDLWNLRPAPEQLDPVK